MGSTYNFVRIWVRNRVLSRPSPGAAWSPSPGLSRFQWQCEPPFLLSRWQPFLSVPPLCANADTETSIAITAKASFFIIDLLSRPVPYGRRLTFNHVCIEKIRKPKSAAKSLSLLGSVRPPAVIIVHDVFMRMIFGRSMFVDRKVRVTWTEVWMLVFDPVRIVRWPDCRRHGNGCTRNTAHDEECCASAGVGT